LVAVVIGSVAIGQGVVARKVAIGCRERESWSQVTAPTYADNPPNGHAPVKLTRYLSEIRQSSAPRDINYLARSCEKTGAFKASIARDRRRANAEVPAVN
jgi:hypothetical protein